MSRAVIRHLSEAKCSLSSNIGGHVQGRVGFLVQLGGTGTNNLDEWVNVVGSKPTCCPPAKNLKPYKSYWAHKDFWCYIHGTYTVERLWPGFKACGILLGDLLYKEVSSFQG